MIRRKKRIQPPIPMAAMGDIAFLLIIFFMLSSNLIEETNKELEMVESPDVEEIAEPPAVTVTMDVDGKILVVGDETSAGGVARKVEELLEGRKDRRVKFICDKTLEKRQFLPVVEALQQAGAVIEAVGQPDENAGS